MQVSLTPVRSKELENLYFIQALSTRDHSLIPLTIDGQVLEEYAAEGVSLYRTKTAGQARTREWSLGFGILDDEGVINVALGDLLRLPKKERERLAGYVVSAPLNARFLKTKLGGGACTDEGEIESWDGTMRP